MKFEGIRRRLVLLHRVSAGGEGVEMRVRQRMADEDHTKEDTMKFEGIRRRLVLLHRVPAGGERGSSRVLHRCSRPGYYRVFARDTIQRRSP